MFAVHCNKKNYYKKQRIFMSKHTAPLFVTFFCALSAPLCGMLVPIVRKISSIKPVISSRHHNNHTSRVALSDQHRMQDLLKKAHDKESWRRTKDRGAQYIEEDTRMVDVPEYGTHGKTLLCYALDHDDIKFLFYLLAQDADPNQNVKETHASKPIFFAQSTEALRLLKQAGADMCAINEGTGIAKGMNLLHASIKTTVPNEDVFNYCLEQGFDPKSLNSTGGTLWHSLVWQSACNLDTEILMRRARKVKQLGIDPLQKNKYGESVITLIRDAIEREEKYAKLNRRETTKMLGKMQDLLALVKCKTTYLPW